MRNKPPEDFPPLGVTTISSPPPEHTLGHNGETTAVPSRVHSLARRGAQKRSWTSMYAEAAGGGNHGIILPGQQILVEEGCMRGLGTYEKGGKIFASVCGILEKVNKLVYVRPLRSRYMGSVGDVVVGRITEILNGKWLVDVNAGQAASLALAAISLPEQRRRLDEDLLEMQNFFVPNDMICCEVQRVR
ncbi:exosome component 2, partial [Cystoisospora suis]